MAAIKNDFIMPKSCPPFLLDKHINYVISIYNNRDKNPELQLMEHIKLNAILWVLTSLDLLGRLNEIDAESVIAFIKSCYNNDGGYGPAPNFSSSIVSTLSALQAFIILDSFSCVDLETTSKYVLSLQQQDGSFAGDAYGDVDTRFLYCAICCLFYMNKLSMIDQKAAIKYIISCMNFDGGFGVNPGDESHAGQVFCCVAALEIMKANNYHILPIQKIGSWLCARQLTSGGLNGRPEKLPDSCYSWWILSPIIILKKLEWISKKNLVKFILECQDIDNGGFTDHPGNEPDIYHTHFGLCGLSLLGFSPQNIAPVHPVFCLSNVVMKRHLTLRPDDMIYFFPDTINNRKE